MISERDVLNDNHTSVSFSAPCVSVISKKHKGVPRDWTTGTTKDLIYYMTSGLSRRLVEHDIGIPVLISGNIQNNKLVLDELKYWYSDDPQGAKIENYVLNEGDILLCFINSLAQIGKPCIYRDIGRPAIYTTNLFRIIVDKSCDGRFAYYLFCTESFQKDLQLIAKTAVNQASFTKPDFLNINICYPSNIKEQTAIANALSDVDALIQELEKLIAKKQAIKTATMQQLLTGRTRLPQFAHHPDGRKKGYKPSELGEIPEDWEVYCFGDVMDSCSSGGTPFRGNKSYYVGTNRWITSGELNYCVIHDTIEKISDEAIKKSNLKVHPAGTFLMAITGLEAAGTRGACAIVGSPATTNQSCMAIYPNEKLLSTYLYYWYVYNGQELAFKYCQGTKQLSYTAGLLKTIPINLPKLIEEQKAISTILTDMDIEVQMLEKRLNKTRQIKQGMMQELLTGKTRLVKPAELA